MRNIDSEASARRQERRRARFASGDVWLKRCLARRSRSKQRHWFPSCILFGPRHAGMEIRKSRFRHLESLLIERLSFSLLVYDIAQDFMEALNFKPEEINTLHYATESYPVRIFEDTNLIVRHVKLIKSTLRTLVECSAFALKSSRAVGLY